MDLYDEKGTLSMGGQRVEPCPSPSPSGEVLEAYEEPLVLDRKRWGWRTRSELQEIINSLVFVLRSDKVKLTRNTRRRLRYRLRVLLIGIDRRTRRNRTKPHYKVVRYREKINKRKNRSRTGGYTKWDLRYYEEVKLPLYRAGIYQFQPGELKGLGPVGNKPKKS